MLQDVKQHIDSSIYLSRDYKVQTLLKIVLFCFFLATRQLTVSEESEMLADSLAKVPDFFVIQSDIGKKSACYLCSLLVEKNRGLFSGKRASLFLGATKRVIKNE